MTRRVGSVTVEAMVLTPLLLFLFICLIDVLFIAHNRVVARADLALLKNSLQQHLAESTDTWTVDGQSDWRVGNVAESVRVDRGLSDLFHLFLNEADLASRASRAIEQSGHAALYEADLSFSTSAHLFTAHYVMRYDCVIHSPFQFVTNHFFGGYQSMSGEMSIPCHSHRQQLHDIALLIDQIEQLGRIEALVKTIRGVLINCLNIL